MVLYLVWSIVLTMLSHLKAWPWPPWLWSPLSPNRAHFLKDDFMSLLSWTNHQPFLLNAAHKLWKVCFPLGRLGVTQEALCCLALLALFSVLAILIPLFAYDFPRSVFSMLFPQSARNSPFLPPTTPNTQHTTWGSAHCAPQSCTSTPSSYLPSAVSCQGKIFRVMKFIKAPQPVSTVLFFFFFF